MFDREVGCCPTNVLAVGEMNALLDACGMLLCMLKNDLRKMSTIAGLHGPILM